MFGDYGNLNCITWATSIRPVTARPASLWHWSLIHFSEGWGPWLKKGGKNLCFYSKMDVCFSLCKPKGLSPRRHLMQFKSENIIPFLSLWKMEQFRSQCGHFSLNQVCLGPAEHLLFVVRRRSSWALATDTQLPTASKQISSSKIPEY